MQARLFSMAAFHSTLIVGFAFVAASAVAQTYPVKPVKIIVPASPGGGIDTVARIAADKLSAAFGQQFIAENRPGAGGRPGTDFAARAAPDGYTLLAGTAGTLILAPALYPKLPYAPARHFAPISMMATTSYLLVSHPSVPATSVKELVALAK